MSEEDAAGHERGGAVERGTGIETETETGTGIETVTERETDETDVGGMCSL